MTANSIDVDADADALNGENSALDPVNSVAHLNSIVPKTEIQALVQTKSNWHGVRQTLIHGLAFFASACLSKQYPIVSTIGMAFVTSFFFCGLHECVHRTAFRTQRWNDVMAQVFGILTLRPAAHYRYYHAAHHKYTGDPTRDSELLPGSLLDFPIDNIVTYVLYLSGLPFFLDAIGTTARHAMGHCPEPYLTTSSARRHVMREAQVYMTVYAVLATLAVRWPTTLGTMLWRYVVQPTVIGQVFLRFYLLPEHRGRTLSPYVTENTRTLHTNAIYRTLAWQMPYHQEHHAWPAVPFYQLHRVHDLLTKYKGKMMSSTNNSANNNDNQDLLEQGEHIASGSKGYLYFHWKFLQTLWKKSDV
jgi:fatty acid desaturase